MSQVSEPFLHDVVEALSDLRAPDGHALLTINDGHNVRRSGERITLSVPLSPDVDRAGLESLADHVRQRLLALPGISDVTLGYYNRDDATRRPDLAASTPSHSSSLASLADVRAIVLVGSGKGGVGKSTLTTNLAVAAAQQGLQVGLLDADVYGPSQHIFFGLKGESAYSEGEILQPLSRHGVKLISTGFLLDEGEALVMRGPLTDRLLTEMAGNTQWGALDLLLVDLPPGTGDVHMSVIEQLGPTGAIIVSTPQDVALADVRKAIDMFDKFKTPLLGLVENMSYFSCPDCHTRTEIFGHGGLRKEAERLGLAFMGEVPLETQINQSGDAGEPVALHQTAYSMSLRGIAEKLTSGLGLTE